MPMKELILLMAFLISGCTVKTSELGILKKETSEGDTSKEPAIIEEEFNTFYRKFNEDSVFQNSRIIPEAGLKGHLDVKHLDTTLFTVRTIQFPDSVYERIQYRKDTTYYIAYSFVKQKGKWMVVSYYDSYYE
jgi:hypothetical protein